MPTAVAHGGQFLAASAGGPWARARDKPRSMQQRPAYVRLAMNAPMQLSISGPPSLLIALEGIAAEFVQLNSLGRSSGLPAVICY